MNLEVEYANIWYAQQEDSLKIGLMKDMEARFERAKQIFQARLEKDKDIFSDAVAKEISDLVAQSIVWILLAGPTALSADTTADASAVIQAHFGVLRVYWAIHPKEEDESLNYSNLNIFDDKVLVYTEGNDFPSMVLKFSKLFMPQIKKNFGVL